MVLDIDIRRCTSIAGTTSGLECIGLDRIIAMVVYLLLFGVGRTKDYSRNGTMMNEHDLLDGFVASHLALEYLVPIYLDSSSPTTRVL